MPALPAPPNSNLELAVRSPLNAWYALASRMTGPAPNSPHDDPLRPDDVLIGRAFRWSVFALALLAAGGGAVWYFKTRPEKRPVQITPLVPPALPERLAPEGPPAQVTD